MENELTLKQESTALLHEQTLDKIATALYDVRKYGDFEEARKMAGTILNNIENDPPIREDKVELAKQRIKSGYYSRYKVIDKTAENLLNAMDC